MVDVLGHFAMALLWALPAWALWDGRVSLVFIGLVLSTAMLPDVDLVLRAVLSVHHHGVTHTILFVTGVALVAGAAVEYGLRDWLERQWLRSEGYTLATGSLFVFVAGGFVLGGLSHLFADILSAPDISTPVEPFWPFLDKPISIDIIWYTSPWWNEGLLALAVGLHLVAAYVDIRLTHPYRISRDAQ